MTVTAADPSRALAAYLKTTDVSAIVSGRIFRPELPAADIKAGRMPRACIVIRRAGGLGLFGGATVPLSDPTLDLFCYGETWLQADQVASAVIPALRSLRGGTFENVRLYWSRIAGGPNPFADPETNWPCLVVSAQVAHYELTVT